LANSTFYEQYWPSDLNQLLINEFYFMNKKLLIVFTSVIIGLITARKQSPEGNENATSEMNMIAVDSAASISSSAATVNKNSNRKFIRTVEVKFKVKNVAKSTYAIEDATSKFGGFVTYTNLTSNIFDENRTKISPDSTLVTAKYKVQNNITIRVPNTKLDTVIKTIAKQIHFLDYRIIKADDVSLQMLSNQMAQRRGISSEKRLENAIDNEGKKLKEIANAEENLNNKKEQNDAAKIENLCLNILSHLLYYFGRYF
jgi:hypothetical protein